MCQHLLLISFNYTNRYKTEIYNVRHNRSPYQRQGTDPRHPRFVLYLHSRCSVHRKHVTSNVDFLVKLLGAHQTTELGLLSAVEFEMNPQTV